MGAERNGKLRSSERATRIQGAGAFTRTWNWLISMYCVHAMPRRKTGAGTTTRAFPSHLSAREGTTTRHVPGCSERVGQQASGLGCHRPGKLGARA